MPIDPTIALRVQRAPQPSLIGRLADLQQFQNAQQQNEINRTNLDNGKSQQGLANLNVLSKLATEMKTLPPEARKSRANQLAAAFESSGNANLAKMLRGYEWTDEDANALASLTRDTEAEWTAATARYEALKGSTAQEATLAQVPGMKFAPPAETVDLPLPGVQFPARAGQPAFTMQPPSAQQGIRTGLATREAQARIDTAAKVEQARLESTIRSQEPTGNEKDFQAWLPSYLESQGLQQNAKTEAAARIEFSKIGKERIPVPGTDVPLPPLVEAQRLRIAATNRVDPEQVVNYSDNGVNKVGILNKTTHQIEELKTPGGGVADAKLAEVPAAIKTQAAAAVTALKQVDNITTIVNANPQLLGPFIGRFEQFMQGVGTNPFAGTKDERLGAQLAEHLNALFAQELRSMFPGRTNEQMQELIKSTSAQLKQNPNLLMGMLEGIKTNEGMVLETAKQQGFEPDRFNPSNGGSGSNAITVTDPTGGVHTFKTQADADTFKKLANIK